jgi:hypothetical protein
MFCICDDQFVAGVGTVATGKLAVGMGMKCFCCWCCTARSITTCFTYNDSLTVDERDKGVRPAFDVTNQVRVKDKWFAI